MKDGRMNNEMITQSLGSELLSMRIRNENMSRFLIVS